VGIVVLLFENTIIESAKGGGHTLIRKQNCLGCNKVLAIEITNKLGKRGEYYVAKGANKTRYGTDILFAKEEWFGNLIQCPNCGRIGRLPMDKPLAAEEIAKPKEVFNAKENIRETKQIKSTR